MFQKKKAALRWDSNPRLAHSRRDALPTEPLRHQVIDANQHSSGSVRGRVADTHSGQKS